MVPRQTEVALATRAWLSGRAPPSHGGGRWFESTSAHHLNSERFDMAKKTTPKKSQKVKVSDLRPPKTGTVKGGKYDYSKNVKI